MAALKIPESSEVVHDQLQQMGQTMDAGPWGRDSVHSATEPASSNESL